MKRGPADGVTRWRFGEDPEPLRRHLLAGGLLAVPTESSYGLAADPRSAAGVEAIYRLKTRERGKPMPVIAAGAEQLSSLGIDAAAPAVRAASAVWPAALSVVVPAADPQGSPWPAAAGGATLAVRVPAHDALRGLLRDLGLALTATSANLSGEPPILDPDELARWLETTTPTRAVLVDGGVLRGGAPSTLVVADAGAWRVLRAGRVAADSLPPLDEDPNDA